MQKPKHMVLKWSLLAGAVLVTFILWQCGSGLYEAAKSSDAAVGRFHALLNQQAYDQIWNEADSDFRDPAKKDDTFKFFAAVHHKLGNARTAQRGGFNVNATTGGTFVRIEYTTTFDNGTAQETYTFKKSLTGELMLVGYNIQSKAFVTN